jgi:hypothetical protein
MQYNFGTGLLTFTPSGSNPSPVQCGVLQSVGFDVDQTMKELRGQYKAPVDVALADLKIAGKAKFAQIFGATLAAVLAGSAQTTGSVRGAQQEVGTIPASSAYTITVANSATFSADLGVYDISSGVRMTRVASGPATGQYSVSSGTYTFASADASHTVWISYSYTSTAGQTVAVTNTLMGGATTFTMTLFNQYSVQGTTKYLGVKSYAVVIPKLSLALANADYTMQDLDFTAFANGSGQIFDFYSSE